jgi:hypothetical protein
LRALSERARFVLSAAAANFAGVAAGFGIDSEHFIVCPINDRQQAGLVVGAFMAPAGWPAQRQAIWNYANTSNAAAVAVKVEKPADLEALYLLALLDLF